jgi:predicted regulator of amino acid metabolism with ACT domain
LEERRRREEEQVFSSTEIENSVIANMAEIGVYPYAVYSVLKMRQASGEANPSYAEIARMTGINRSTVIRSVKKLTDLNLLSP